MILDLEMIIVLVLLTLQLEMPQDSLAYHLSHHHQMLMVLRIVKVEVPLTRMDKLPLIIQEIKFQK